MKTSDQTLHKEYLRKAQAEIDAEKGRDSLEYMLAYWYVMFFFYVGHTYLAIRFILGFWQ